jgi:hypothetical protein
MSHESSNKFLISIKAQTTIASPQNSASMSLSVFDFIMNRKRHVPGWQQTTELHSAPYETKRSEKNMGAHDQIPSDPAISRHEAPSGVHQRSIPKLDTPARSIRASIHQIFVLAREEP